jgi:TDG/mug DNA glycosylase family protein
MIKRSFPPVVDQHTRLLLLGSLPGEISLAQGRYYAHPRNQFWLLIGAVIGVDLAAMDYPDRLQALLAAGVGLWDVVESAARTGSLDSNIRLHSPNKLAKLSAGLPKLVAVGFNGGRSAAIGRKQLADTIGLKLIDLPSSSPAYTLPFAEKRERWLQLRDSL